MSCEQNEMVLRLSVEDPEALKTTSWVQHLRKCPECRGEQIAMDRSLAVFRQLEVQSLPAASTGPDWEQFERVLSHRKCRRWGFQRLRIPMAAASVAALLVSGWMIWPSLRDNQFRPEKIISMEPEQQPAIQGILRHSVVEDRSSETFRFPSSQYPSRTVSSFPTSQANPPSPVITLRSNLLRKEKNARAPVILFRSLRQKRYLGLEGGSKRKPVIQTQPALSPIIRAPRTGAFETRTIQVVR